MRGGLPRGARAFALASVWARSGEVGLKRTMPPTPAAAACRMAAASPILAPVITRTAASCWLDQPAGSCCPGAGVGTGGVGTEGDPGARPEAVGAEADTEGLGLAALGLAGRPKE